MKVQRVRRDALLLLHEETLAKFGGASGLRDYGMLESALMRPENKLLYEPGTTLHRLAAAYCLGLAKNHPFIDGNKRTALTAIIVFLGLNGFRLEATQIEVEEAILAVVSGEMDEDQLAGWLVRHTAIETQS